MNKIYVILTMSIPYILFYSNGCNHSTKIINVIKQHPIGPNVSYFCIDGIMTLPDYLQYTPTMRVIKGPDRYIISGSDIYTWLNSISPIQSPPPVNDSKNPQDIQRPQRQRQQRHRPAPEPEPEEESYQTTGDTSNDLDRVFSVQNTDTAAAELDAMFKSKPVSTRMTCENGNFMSKMEEIENARKELDDSLKKQ